MVVVENKSESRIVVSVSNSVINSFDAAPVVVNPRCDEKWMRFKSERVVVMTRHGWYSSRIPRDGYVRISNRNIYVLPESDDSKSGYYTWFENPVVNFLAEGFPFSMEDVREICLMEHKSAQREQAIMAECEEKMGDSNPKFDAKLIASEG